jgi:hypothetical protein
MVQIRKDFSKPASSHSLNWAILKQKKPNGQGKKAAEPPAFSQLLVALAPFASGESNSHMFIYEGGNLNVSRRLHTSRIHSGDSL